MGNLPLYMAFHQHFGGDITSASFTFNWSCARGAMLTHAAWWYAAAHTGNLRWFYVTSLPKCWWNREWYQQNKHVGQVPSNSDQTIARSGTIWKYITKQLGSHVLALIIWRFSRYMSGRCYNLSYKMLMRTVSL